MECEDCRDAMSARLDGEDLPGEADAVDAHLEECAQCRRFADRAVHVTRLTRTRAVEPVPDLAAAVVGAAAAAPRRRRRPGPGAVRLALGAVGIGQCALVVNDLVSAGLAPAAAHHGAVELAGASATHFVHESSAWNLALAVGFLWVATGTSRVSGLVPVVGAFVGVLTALSAVDVLGGRVDPGRLVTHGLVVLGLALLVVLQRMTRRGGGGAARGPGRRTARVVPRAWPERQGLRAGPDDRLDGDGPAPSGRHRAA